LNAEGLRFYGDILLSRGIEKSLPSQGKSTYEALSSFLKKDAIHIANLEGAVGDSCNCDKDKSICFAINPSSIPLLKGFNVVSLENNHSLDLGLKSIKKTCAYLLANGVTPLAGLNNCTIIETVNGNVGIIAVTDVLNSPKDSAAVSMAKSSEVLNQIKKLKFKCTIVAVYIHWGRELLPIATTSMRQLAQNYIDAGADLIVGAHTHVVGPVEIINNRPVFYSLGNLLFDQKYEETKKGIVLDCNFSDRGFFHCSIQEFKSEQNSYLPKLSSANEFDKHKKIISSFTFSAERTWTGKFTNSRDEQKIVLKNQQGDSLTSIELYDLNSQKLLIKTPFMPIRKLQPVDLNGDGISEILLVQEIYSSFDKENAKRVYIYSFKKGFHALWRGTALARPLLDVVYVPSIHRLVALHSADSFIKRKIDCTERIIMSYKWNGFGFSGVKELVCHSGCSSLTLAKNRIKVVNNNEISETIIDSTIK
jgi:poly-gamma-glutamate synthesis protein (capsule biosynthesis protein)